MKSYPSSFSLLSAIATLLASHLAYADPKPVGTCYTVPVKNELRDFANFPVLDGSINSVVPGQPVVIQYRLPEDIVGKGGKLITLTGTAPEEADSLFNVAEADTKTQGSCIHSAKSLTCMLHYSDLKLDNEENQTFLKAKYSADTSLDKRLQVMQQFSGDAIGILQLFFP